MQYTCTTSRVLSRFKSCLQRIRICGSENLHCNIAKLFWLMKHLRPFVNVSKSNFKNFWTSESLFFFIFSINACPWINKRNLTISGYHTYKWMVLIFHIFNTCNWSSLLTSDVRIRHLSTARKFKWMFTLPAMSVLHLYTITKRKEMYGCVNEKKRQSVLNIYFIDISAYPSYYFNWHIYDQTKI